MSKPKTERALKETEAKAVCRMIRVSPQKLNLLAQLIRGKRVETALADLEFSRKRIALDVRKTLQSAISNAENNHDLDVDDLIVGRWERRSIRACAVSSSTALRSRAGSPSAASSRSCFTRTSRFAKP